MAGELRKVGAELVAEGKDKFKGALDEGSRALSDFERSAHRVGDSIDIVGEIAVGALRHIGELAVQGFGRLISSAGLFLEEAKAAEIGVARLDLVIDNLGDQAGVTTDQARNLASSLADLAEGNDDAVLSVIEMGLRTGEVAGKDLPRMTKAALDLAAATGIDGSRAMRLFSQAMDAPSSVIQFLRRQGVLFTKELREQIKSLEETGNVAEAFSMFMDRVSQSVGGAAEKMAQTLGGQLTILKNRLLDIGENAFTPLLDNLGRFVREARPFLEGFANLAATTFSGMAENALTWGESLVTEFANGMINGIVAVLQALSAIGDLVASWLSPGSPPRLLPDIDEWGQSAIAEYMKGWTQIDVSVFDQIAQPFERFIRSMAGADRTGAAESVFQMREALASVVDELRTTGVVTEEMTNRVIASLGQGGESARDYAQAQLELAAADLEVAAAQKELSDVTAKYDEELEGLNEQLAELQNKKASKEEEKQIERLQRIASDTGASDARRARAQEELDELLLKRKIRQTQHERDVSVDAAEDKLEAARKEQELAKERLAPFEAMFQAQQKNIDLLNEMQNALKAVAAAAGAIPKAAAGGGKGVFKALTDIDVPEALAGFDTLQEQLFMPVERIKLAFAGLGESWDRAWAAIQERTAPIRISLSQLADSAERLFAAVVEDAPLAQQAIADFVIFLTDQLGTQAVQIIDNLAASIDVLTKFWEAHGESVIVIVTTALELVTLVFISTFNLLLGIVTAMLQLISGDFEGFGETLNKTVESFMAGVLAVVGVKLDDFYDQWRENWRLLKLIVDTKTEEIVEAIVAWFDDTVRKFKGWIDDVIKAITETDWGAVGQSIIDGIVAGIVAAAHKLVEAAIAAVTSALSAVQQLLQGHSPSQRTANEIGEPFVTGIIKGIQGALGGLDTAVSGVVEHLVAPPATAAAQAGGTTYAPTYNYAPTYSVAPRNPSQDFAVMRVLAGTV